MELILLIIVISPLLALIQFILLLSQNGVIKTQQRVIDYYAKKYGELSEKEKGELGAHDIIVDSFRNDGNYDKATIEEKGNKILEDIYAKSSRENKVVKNVKVSKEVKKPVKTEKKKDELTINEYIKKNNISNGNIIFALGVLFISAAGLVFATTTWQTIPNIFKVVILFAASLVLLLLSYLSKEKFKLIKTSITLYVLFGILISFIPISLGFFNMLPFGLNVLDKNQFLLYAISLLTLIISFIYGIKIYEKSKLVTVIPYAVNIELLLIVLNFTKKYDVILLLLSIYNLVFILLPYFIKIKNKIFNIFSKEANTSIVLLSLLSILHSNTGSIYAILLVVFSIIYMTNLVDTKEDVTKVNRFIIGSILLLISGGRIELSYIKEYYTFIFLILVLIYLFAYNKLDKKFNYLFYSIGLVQLVSSSVSIINESITIILLVSMGIILISIILLYIKNNDKYLMYIKSIYYYVFSFALSDRLSLLYGQNRNYYLMILIGLLLLGYFFVNLITKIREKNKFSDIIINCAYKILIAGLMIWFINISYKLTSIYYLPFIIISILLYIALNLYNERINKKDKQNELNQNISLASYIIIFFINIFTYTWVFPTHLIVCVMLLIISFYYFIKENTKISSVVLFFMLFSVAHRFDFYTISNLYMQRLIPSYDILSKILSILVIVFGFCLAEFYKYKNKYIFRKLENHIVVLLYLGLLTYFECISLFINHRDIHINGLILSFIFNAYIIYLKLHYEKTSDIVKYSLPVTSFAFTSFLFSIVDNTYFTGIILLNLGITNVFIFTAIIYMVLSILGLGIKRLYEYTKLLLPYILVLLTISYFSRRIFIFRMLEIRLLFLYITIYTILFIKSIYKDDLSKNKNYVSFLVVFQFLLMEYEIITELLRFIFRLPLSYKYIYFVYMMSIIILNFIIYNISSLISKKIKSAIKSLSSIYERILPIGLYILVFFAFQFFVGFATANTIKTVHLKYTLIYFISALILIFITSKQSKDYKLFDLSRVYPFVIIYLLPNFFIENYIIVKLIIICIFIAYYIMSILNKNEFFKYNNGKLSLSYFAFANLMIFLHYSDIFEMIPLNTHGIRLLLTLSIFVLQFLNAYKDKYFNKTIYFISFSLFTLSLILQKIFMVPTRYYIEYVSLILSMYIFIADKVIYKFKKTTSDYIWFVSQIIIGFVLLYRAITVGHISNILIFGITTFIILILSYIYKKYKNFLLSVLLLVILLIYVTRKFWLSIAWWVYLLAVGILLILFATKNEQLKKQNKNIKSVFESKIDNVKKWLS